jgi:SPP1 gp7 family putative phage head morphogenesis protein
MTTASKLLRIVADFRQRLLAREAKAAQTMDVAHAETLRVIEAELAKLYDAMTEAIASGQPWSLYKLYEANRLEVLRKLITGQIDQFGALARTMTGRLQEGAMLMGLDAAMQMLNAQVPDGVSWSFGVPSVEALTQLVGATQAGSPLATLFAGFGAEAAHKAEQALIAGVTLGQNPREFAPLVQDALNVSRARALTISRTEGLRAYRNGSLAVYRANSDVVTKYRRTAAKNSRTCAACIALDGTLYDIDKEFAIHPNDRCTTIPLTKDWSEILGPLGIDTSQIPDTRPNIETGAAWLARQSEKVQRDVLGAKYQGWKDGAFTLQDIVKHTHSDEWGDGIQEKSLKELVKS